MKYLIFYVICYLYLIYFPKNQKQLARQNEKYGIYVL